MLDFAFALPPCDAAAQDRPALTIEARTVAVGQRAEIVVTLEGADADLPVLVTATTEGRAIDVVQARPPKVPTEDGRVQFRVPILAQAAGTAVLHVRAWSYRCDEARCRAFQTERRVPITVSTH